MEELADRGRDVVMVVHLRGVAVFQAKTRGCNLLVRNRQTAPFSYEGGNAAEGLSKIDRSEVGKQGGLVSICTYVRLPGLSVHDALKNMPECVEIDGDVCRATRMDDIFCNDVSPDIV